jgi:tetratricopeptide (TPR) repeat protein
VDLSAEMTASYKQLAATGREDIELLTTIATSLEQVASHGEGLSLASLLKAATTATDLADSVSVPEDAKVIHGLAASLYQAILKAGLPDADNEKAIRFRLAAAFSKARRFEESLQLYGDLLSDQPNQLVRAITGNPDTPSIWGWAKLSQTYQRLLARDQSRDDYQERFLETRLHIAECRLAFARQLAGSKNSKKKTAELEKAMRELSTLARTSNSYNAPTWSLLDAIYRDIQKELNRNPEPLFDKTSVTPKPAE